MGPACRTRGHEHSAPPAACRLWVIIPASAAVAAGSRKRPPRASLTPVSWFKQASSQQASSQPAHATLNVADGQGGVLRSPSNPQDPSYVRPCRTRGRGHLRVPEVACATDPKGRGPSGPHARIDGLEADALGGHHAPTRPGQAISGPDIWRDRNPPTWPTPMHSNRGASPAPAACS